MAIEMTFGLTPEDIKRIKEEIKRFDDVLTDESELSKGWIVYDSMFWERMGKELQFLPLTLCLLWQRYELNEQKANQAQEEALKLTEDLYTRSVEAAMVLFASAYEKCRANYQEKYYKICSVDNPDRRELTDFESNILHSFPQVQGYVNIRSTERISKVKTEKGLSLKEIAEALEERYSA